MHASPATTLENCDREPIHAPGSVQSHGALLAFDRLGRLSHASANAQGWLGPLPALGGLLPESALGGDAELHGLLHQAVQSLGSEELSMQSTELRLNGRSFDVVMHVHQGRVLCEFESRPTGDSEVARFAHMAYRAMDGLKRRKSIDKLLSAAVLSARELTGFDRVMAYRFRHDDSGDVVAEACDPALEPYLGRRYPASDIPAQARRLYTVNTLRLIADVGDEPVPLLAEASQLEPLDLSHSVLRSVSPIHIEYLRNMGVGASMSVSIVVGGRLWGMLACHHMAPRRAPYPIRMALDVMAQVIASTVQSLQAQAREAAVSHAAWLRTELAQAIGLGTEMPEIVRTHAAALRASLRCDAMLLVLDGAVQWLEGADPAWAASLVDWLAARDDKLVHVDEAARLPPHPPGAAPELRCCGLLALRFDAMRPCWIVALRREQVQTIRWGGKPEKVVSHGPLGPRLTPRGSFAEWRETVRDTAEPWDAVELEIASQLLDSVSRASTERVREIDHLRSQLWAMLGHDLRGPLQSLSMASHVLDRGQQQERMNAVIRNSTQRMKQLIGNVLDVSRLHHGFELTLAFDTVDLVPLIDQLLEESRIAHPTVPIDADLPGTLRAQVDPVRFAQVVANLLSNARHHGQGEVGLRAWIDERRGEAVLEVSNTAPPIPPEIAASLFEPFKRPSTGNLRNRTGMGLGLYIAHQVVQGHGGRLDYRADRGRVSFEMRVPLRRAAA